MSSEPLDLHQVQPPRPVAADEVSDIPEPERQARLLAALRAFLELPPRTRDQEPEG
jgi:hypothetical protein